MPLVAKRKLNETWRDAVAQSARRSGNESAWMAVFEAFLSEGRHEAEAAYLTLAQFGALTLVADGPLPGRSEEP